MSGWTDNEWMSAARFIQSRDNNNSYETIKSQIEWYLEKDHEANLEALCEMARFYRTRLPVVTKVMTALAEIKT